MKLIDEPPIRINKKEKMQAQLQVKRAKTNRFSINNLGAQDFYCANCRLLVSSLTLISGVQNRNHCPYCLYSRHLDLYQAGDRLSACRAKMRPVGLTIKHNRKKYSFGKSGELMLVHICSECLKVSINRVAADDDSGSILELFFEIDDLDIETQYHLDQNGIKVLGREDTILVHARLFGKNQFNNQAKIIV